MGDQSRPTQTRTEPWAKQIPYIESGFDMAAKLYGMDVGAFGGNTNTSYPNVAPGYNQTPPQYPGQTTTGKLPQYGAQDQSATRGLPPASYTQQAPQVEAKGVVGDALGQINKPNSGGAATMPAPTSGYQVPSDYQIFGLDPGTLYNAGTGDQQYLNLGYAPHAAIQNQVQWVAGADPVNLYTNTDPWASGYDTPEGQFWVSSHPQGANYSSWRLAQMPGYSDWLGSQDAPPAQDPETLPVNDYKNYMAATGPQYFPYETLAGEADQTTLARDLITQRALNDPLQSAATGGLLSTMQGGFLGSNPWLDYTFDRAAGQAMGQVNSQFGKMGRVGSGAHQQLMGQQMNDLAANIYGNNYEQERNRMMQAYGMSGDVGANDYRNLAALQSVGQDIQNRNQQEVDSALQRWNYQENLPYMQLADYLDLVQGGYGGTTMQAMAPESAGDKALRYGLGGLGATLGLSGLFLRNERKGT